MPISPYVAGLRAKIGTELLLLPSASVVVFDDAGRVMLAREVDTGSWMIVGGAIDPDERPADAAAREFREETGGIVEVMRLVGVFAGPEFRKTYPNGDAPAYVVSLFEGRITGGAIAPDGVETSEIGWFSEAECTTLALSKISRILLPYVFASRGSTASTFQPVTFCFARGDSPAGSRPPRA